MYKGMPEMMELADERQQKSKQNKNEYSDRSIMRVLLPVHIGNYDRPTNQPTNWPNDDDTSYKTALNVCGVIENTFLIPNLVYEDLI